MFQTIYDIDGRTFLFSNIVAHEYMDNPLKETDELIRSLEDLSYEWNSDVYDKCIQEKEYPHEGTLDECFICPDCSETLDETIDTSKLYCIKCQHTISVDILKSKKIEVSVLNA